MLRYYKLTAVYFEPTSCACVYLQREDGQQSLALR